MSISVRINKYGVLTVYVTYSPEETLAILNTAAGVYGPEDTDVYPMLLRGPEVIAKEGDSAPELEVIRSRVDVMVTDMRMEALIDVEHIVTRSEAALVRAQGLPSILGSQLAELNRVAMKQWVDAIAERRAAFDDDFPF